MGDLRAAVDAGKAGSTDYLITPFALDELLHILDTVTDRARMQE